MKKAVFSLVAISLALSQTAGQGADGQRTLAIRAGKIVTVTAGVVEGGVIIIRDGKITAVGQDPEIPGDIRLIDAKDKTVVPGFIDAHSHLGLSLDVLGEIDETVQPVTAEMQIIDAFDPTAEALAQAIRCGVTAAMLAPGARNPIGGQAAVVKLSGDSQQRWLVKQTAGVKLSFADDALMSDRRPTSRPGLITLLKGHLDKAKTYTPTDFDPEASVLNLLTQRKLPAYVYAQTIDEITAALHIIDEYNLQAVLVGGHQADEIAQMLVERNIPVICGPLLLHSKDMDLKRVGKLAGAGAKIAFASFAPKTYAGDVRTSAILAVRYGMAREDALKALTINAAELLGAAARLGSIQQGRDADLVILDGDPLETSSRIEMVIIDGKIVYRREQK